MTVPYKCPVCNGWGKRRLPPEEDAERGQVDCKACAGTGVLWGIGWSPPRPETPDTPWPPWAPVPPGVEPTIIASLPVMISYR